MKPRRTRRASEDVRALLVEAARELFLTHGFDGTTTKEIAHQLEISDVTVRRHIGALIRKLGVPNRKAALALVESTTFV